MSEKELDFDYLVGKKILEVKRMGNYDAEHYGLLLDNGEILVVAENEGCGGCGNGWSSIDLLELKTTDATIIEVDYNLKDDEKGDLTIFYHDKRFDTIPFDEGGGNGYYGGGFHLRLIKKGEEEK